MTIYKTCTKCKEHKPLEEFSKSKSTRDGHMYTCKECNRTTNRKFRETPSGIYTNIISRQNFFKKHNDPRAKPVTITREEFIDWYNSTELECDYCEIPQEDFLLLKEKYGSRTKRLTVDCVENSLGYSIDNIVLACERCNQIKSNLLTYAEMKEIGIRFIKPKWMALKNGESQVRMYLKTPETVKKETE